MSDRNGKGRLALGVDQGDSVFVGGHEITVSQVYSPRRFQITVDTPDFVKKFDIDQDHEAEVLPEVLVSAGVGDSFRARMLIRAPRRIEIERRKVKQRRERAEAQ